MAQDIQVIVQGGGIALSFAGAPMYTKSVDNPAGGGWVRWGQGISEEPHPAAEWVGWGQGTASGWSSLVNMKGQLLGESDWPTIVTSNIISAGRPIRLLSSVYRNATQEHHRIGSSPEVLAGKPCIKGTRVPVSLVLRYLATDEDPIEDLDVSKSDVQDCLKFAASICDERV